MEKQCSQCKQIKPVSEFRKKLDGYDSACKGCEREKDALYRTTHREQRRKGIREYSAKRYRERPELWVPYRRKDEEVRRKRRLEIVRTLQENQGEGCAICGDIVSIANRALAIDHDHTTGKLRGLLCHYCNTGLGSFKDNPDLLRKAALYLEECRERETA